MVVTANVPGNSLVVKESRKEMADWEGPAGGELAPVNFEPCCSGLLFLRRRGVKKLSGSTGNC